MHARCVALQNEDAVIKICNQSRQAIALSVNQSASVLSLTMEKPKSLRTAIALATCCTHHDSSGQCSLKDNMRTAMLAFGE